MTDDDQHAEIERLKGRIAALEGICAAVLTQLVSGDADARRSIAEGMRSTAVHISARTEAAKGAVEGYLKVAANLVRDLE